MGGPLRSLRVLDASEGLHLGRLSLLEAKALAKKIAGIQRFKVKKYLYIYIHLYIYVYICTYIYTYMYTYIYIKIIYGIQVTLLSKVLQRIGG